MLFLVKKKKGKAVPVTGHGGPLGCETSRLSHFLDNRLTDGGEVVCLMCQPPFTPRENPGGTHFCQRLSRQQGHCAAATIKWIEKSNDLVRIWTRELTACSIVPQPTYATACPIHMCMKTLTQFCWFVTQRNIFHAHVKIMHFIYNSVTFFPIGIDPRSLALPFERLPFHLSTADQMLSCYKGGHTFAALCCGNSRDWNGSLWSLHTVLFQTLQSNGFKSEEFPGH
jgi:hypothetical protein